MPTSGLSSVLDVDLGRFLFPAASVLAATTTTPASDTVDNNGVNNKSALEVAAQPVSVGRPSLGGVPQIGGSTKNKEVHASANGPKSVFGGFPYISISGPITNDVSNNNQCGEAADADMSLQTIDRFIRTLPHQTKLRAAGVCRISIS
ncbi:hypothetical protein OROMI_009221 [Orobanche minor]